MATQKFDVSNAAVTTMVREVLSNQVAVTEGQATYLRMLVAAVQVELGAEPRVNGKGRVRPVEGRAALAALATTHERFYGIVVANLDKSVPAKVRNGQSAFARSSASTLRSAVRAGLNPLRIAVPAVTKEWLRKWTLRHAPESKRVPSVKRASRSAVAVVRRLGAIIEPLSPEAKIEVLDAFHKELMALDAVVHYEPDKQFTKTHIIPTRPRLRRPTEQRLAA